MRQPDMLSLGFKLNGDGTGFWDSYEKPADWLGARVAVSVAARSVSPQLAALYENLMADQARFDEIFKEFAANSALDELRGEWGNEALQPQDIRAALTVSEITLGFDADTAFCFWFRSPGIKSEHGVQVYGDQNGKPTRVGRE